MNWTDIPIFINAKDRKSCLEALLNRLDKDGLINNAVVLDTGSSYPPMLDFLEHLPCRLIRYTPKHSVQNAIWEADPELQSRIQEYGRPAEGWYVYTDCDVVPDCPPGWLEAFFETAKCHTGYPKLGMGLRIDDLPDHYKLKAQVIEWESQFWCHGLNSAWYVSPVDTTLALYRPGAPPGLTHALRSAPPYVARHLPWYYDSEHPTEEWIYYLEHMAPGVGHWSRGDRKLLLNKP